MSLNLPLTGCFETSYICVCTSGLNMKMECLINMRIYIKDIKKKNPSHSALVWVLVFAAYFRCDVDYDAFCPRTPTLCIRCYKTDALEWKGGMSSAWVIIWRCSSFVNERSAGTLQNNNGHRYFKYGGLCLLKFTSKGSAFTSRLSATRGRL